MTNLKKNLWVVEFRPPNPGLVPEPRFWPDFDHDDTIQVVVADQFYALVYTDLDHLQQVVRDFPYVRITGHPADGRWIGEGGEDLYIVDAKVIEDEWQAWEALGLRPQDFGATTWHDVDDDVVRHALPTY